LVVLDLISKL
jgi:hypothetical protein